MSCRIGDGWRTLVLQVPGNSTATACDSKRWEKNNDMRDFGPPSIAQKVVASQATRNFRQNKFDMEATQYPLITLRCSRECHCQVACFLTHGATLRQQLGSAVGGAVQCQDLALMLSRVQSVPLRMSEPVSDVSSACCLSFFNCLLMDGFSG